MKQKGFALILIILVVATLGIVGYLSFNNPPTQKNLEPTPASSKTSDAAFKIYTNKRKGFSLSYPSDWYVSADDSSQTTLVNFPPDNPNEDKENLIMYVGEYNETIQNGADLIIWLKENDHWSSDTYGEPTETGQTTIAGNPGIILIYSGNSPFYVFSVGSRVFWAYQSPRSPDFNQTFIQILSTIKFTQ